MNQTQRNYTIAKAIYDTIPDTREDRKANRPAIQSYMQARRALINWAIEDLERIDIKHNGRLTQMSDLRELEQTSIKLGKFLIKQAMKR